MAFDCELAERVRKLLASRAGISERRMFGGLCFLMHGNMCCGITGNDLMVRTGPLAYAEALAQPHAREMDFTGRPMRGLVFISPEGTRSDQALAEWLERGLSFAVTLVPK